MGSPSASAWRRWARRVGVGHGAAGGAKGRWEAEGQALLPEDDVDAGRGLGIGFLKAAKRHKRRGRS